MIQFLRLSEVPADQRARILRRAEKDIRDLFPVAEEVIHAVRTRGDAGVVEYARKFDASGFEAHMLRATPADFAAARRELTPEVIKAIEDAHRNIEHFHRAQMPEPMWFTQVAPGILAGEKTTPVTSVGLYVPRGKGAFPSVMLMLATPAVVAGVPRV
ncbi:MAG: histidinol dehydrogenase, partial [Anaerolinea sp.]|nr:histidinol dehydrogenase [Anaerolinea sp.]